MDITQLHLRVEELKAREKARLRNNAAKVTASDVPNTFGACFYMEPYGGRPTARVPNVLFSGVKMKAGCSEH